MFIAKRQKPIYYNDNIISAKISPSQREAIEELRTLLLKNELVLKQNKCLCQNEHSENDIIISEKDRYGLPFPQIICSKCGLIRSGLVFDESSNNIFYEKLYRRIYTSGLSMNEFFYEYQINQGRRLLKILQKNIPIDDINIVAEDGCGAGGLLLPFKEIGKQVYGNDYNLSFLEYGKNKGINTFYGEFTEMMEEDSCDLIILSHVLEHFLDPISELQKIISRLKKNKYMIVEVPGIFNIGSDYVNPILYFQNAHVYNFYAEFLKVFFETNGLKVIYGDEYCDFILQKQGATDHCSKNEKVPYNERLSKYPQLILQYLIKQDRKYRRNKYLNEWKRKSLYVANKVGWQKIKLIIKKITHL